MRSRQTRACSSRSIAPRACQSACLELVEQLILGAARLVARLPNELCVSTQLVADVLHELLADAVRTLPRPNVQLRELVAEALELALRMMCASASSRAGIPRNCACALEGPPTGSVAVRLATHGSHAYSTSPLPFDAAARMPLANSTSHRPWRPVRGRMRRRATGAWPDSRTRAAGRQPSGGRSWSRSERRGRYHRFVVVTNGHAFAVARLRR